MVKGFREGVRLLQIEVWAPRGTKVKGSETAMRSGTW